MCRKTKMISKTLKHCNLAHLFRHILICEKLIFLVILENAEKKQGKKVVEEIFKKFLDKRQSIAAFKSADVGAVFRKRNDRFFEMGAK